jgi:NADPH2 dehydrogenase
MDSALFKPKRVGRINLSHRVVMAPMTRFRAHDDFVPSNMMVEYYTQRASTPGTLLITEGTIISIEAGGYPNVPGVWSEDQIRGWKKVSCRADVVAELLC